MPKVGADVFIGIVHYSPLVERKKNLEELEKEFPELEWITEKAVQNNREYEFEFVHELKIMSEFDFASGLRLNSFSQKYSRRTSDFIVKLLRIGSKFIKRAESSILGSLPQKRPLPKHWGEVSLMHLEALKRGLASNKEWILVLEDDAIIQKNFVDSIEDLDKFSSHDKTWINLNDGTGPNLFKHKSGPELNFGGFFQVTPPMTRCTVAYAVNRELAREILYQFKLYGITDWIPIDFAFDSILKKMKAKCVWQDPASVLQGSSNGNYLSNLQQHRSANDC